jgi:predicted RNA-binding Zn-ribbon protein involved in translation (DUF1610 family)
MVWRISQFREIQALDPDERRQILASIPWRIYPHMIIKSVMAGLIVSVVSGAVVYSLGNAIEAATAISGLLVGTGLCYQGLLRRIQRDMRLTIARAFDGQRLPFCLFCGYDLRAATADKCPECGKGVVPNFPKNRTASTARPG